MVFGNEFNPIAASAPLNLNSISVGSEGIEPSTSVLPCPTATGLHARCVGCLGIEPSTSFLSGKRSTNELAAPAFVAGAVRKAF